MAARTRFPNGFWSQKENQKTFFLNLGKKLNIQNLNDWGRVTATTISDNGGSSILFNIYGGSLRKALMSVFPETAWKKEWFSNRSPPGFWKEKKNQRQFFEELRKKFHLKEKIELLNLNKKEIKENGGQSILLLYGGNIQSALQASYPEVNWTNESSSSGKRSYWMHKENQKKFLDGIAKEFSITEPSDWKKVSVKAIIKMGGQGLMKQYSNSLTSALQSIYSITPDRKRRGYWRDQNNLKTHTDLLASKLQIKSPKHWGDVNLEALSRNGGNSFLLPFKGSISKALKAIYPTENWKSHWMATKPHGYWADKNNQRDFLRDIGSKLGVKSPKDWGKVTNQQLIMNGASSLLNRYQGSLWRTLNSIYPEEQWRRKWFRGPTYSRTFWNSLENQRNFLHQIASLKGITKTFDWRKITASYIRKNGGLGLLKKYGGSLKTAIKKAFPNSWDAIPLIVNEPSAPQHEMNGMLQQIFSESTAFSNYRGSLEKRKHL